MGNDLHDPERIKEIVQSIWKPHSELIGQQNLNDIISGVLRGQADLFESRGGGTDFDVWQALQLLVWATTLIKFTIDMADRLKKKLKRKVTLSDIENALAQGDHVLPDAWDKISAEKRKQIILNVLRSEV